MVQNHAISQTRQKRTKLADCVNPVVRQTHSRQRAAHLHARGSLDIPEIYSVQHRVRRQGIVVAAGLSNPGVARKRPSVRSHVPQPHELAAVPGLVSPPRENIK